MSNEISNDVEVEVYYYSKIEGLLSTQRLNYVNLNIENNQNIDYETTRGPLLYSQQCKRGSCWLYSLCFCPAVRILKCTHRCLMRLMQHKCLIRVRLF